MAVESTRDAQSVHWRGCACATERRDKGANVVAPIAGYLRESLAAANSCKLDGLHCKLYSNDRRDAARGSLLNVGNASKLQATGAQSARQTARWDTCQVIRIAVHGSVTG